MLRLVFEKKGDSVWISHLDLMRVFQRAFRRAELMLKHSQGFTPRAIVSIALPLSVGVESNCELLDFELEGQVPAHETIVQKLNETLPAGIRVLQVYEATRMIKELTHLRADLYLEYDSGVPVDAVRELEELLSRDSLIVVKHSRKGDTETDIRPLLKGFTIRQTDERTLVAELTVCAQNPSLNPQLIVEAIKKYCPQLLPNFSRTIRTEVFDDTGKIFR